GVFIGTNLPQAKSRCNGWIAERDPVTARASLGFGPVAGSPSRAETLEATAWLLRRSLSESNAPPQRPGRPRERSPRPQEFFKRLPEPSKRPPDPHKRPPEELDVGGLRRRLVQSARALFGACGAWIGRDLKNAPASAGCPKSVGER